MIDLTGGSGAAAYSGLEVVAGDDEDGGAASVAEGMAATAVLGVGEEDGEVRRGLGVAKVVSACVGDVRMGRGEDGGLQCSRGSGVDGAAAPTGPRGKKCVKQMRVFAVIQLTKEGELGGATDDEMDDGVARLRQDANDDSKR